MLKRGWALLLCLALLIGLVPPAASAETSLPVAELIWLGDDSQTIAATAVHVAFGEETVWLAPAALLPDDVILYLLTERGDYTQVLRAEELGGSGLAVLTLAEPELLTEAISLSRSGTVGPITGYLADGSRVESPVERVAPATLRGRSGITLTSLPGVLSGAVITDREGLLSGLVMGSWGEGEGRYGAFTAEGITEALLAADRTTLPLMVTDPAQLELQATPVHATVTCDRGFIRVDWRNRTFQGVTKEGVYAAVVSDTENSYYSSIMVRHGDERLAIFPCVPGRTYKVWVGYWPEEPDNFGEIMLWPEEAEIVPPDMGEVTDYGFRQECWLALVPADRELTGMEKLDPAEEITRELLESGELKLCLQVVNHYSVDKEINDSLVFALFGPDGTCAAEESGYIYAPQYMPDDIWNKDFSDLLADMTWGVDRYPDGTYTAAYYIGGCLAGSVSFTLTGGETPAEDEPVESPDPDEGMELSPDLLLQMLEMMTDPEP